MQISGLLTSLGINMGICALFFSIYSVLRKQPSNRRVYFARTLAQMRSKRHDPHWFDRFVPSPRWLMQAWELTDSQIMKIGGLDAVVFVRALVFSIRIFSIASIICLFLVLPLNYYGKDIQHKRINSESLEVFTIQNVKQGSRWLWAHCLALYIVCCSACILLYFEYKDVSRLRLTHLRESLQKPSHFTVLVRGIPLSSEANYRSSVEQFFTKYYPTSYVSHEMVYRCGKMVKLMKTAEKMYDLFSINNYATDSTPCNYCVGQQNSSLPEETNEKAVFNCDNLETPLTGKECGAAFVFFKSRCDAATIGQARLSSNPMLWVTDLAPEPSDVYWSNLGVPYKQFWMRKIATLTATTAFMIFFLLPVAFVQGLANLDKFIRAFPFLKGFLEIPTVNQVVTGYLPSLILILFLLIVPPLMILFSTIEGSISRSGRKKAACLKVLYFNIWNVFFVNLVSGTLVNQISILSNPKDIPKELATRAVPALVKFFMTYVLTSGWASLAIELVQLYPLLVNSIYKFILRKKDGPFGAGFTFPFHTEVPRVLLFGLLGFTFSVLAPLILPLLLIYFCLAYFIYRNQISNVYLFEYDTGGQYWPIVHNTTIFSMVLAQIMALGVFATKTSPVCMGFTVVLIVFTLLFNEYCRQRFLPIFKNIASQELIEMDQLDEATAKEEIYKRVKLAYSQNEWVSFNHSSRCKHLQHCKLGDPACSRNAESSLDIEPGVVSLHEAECTTGQQTPPRVTGSGEKPIDGHPLSPVKHASVVGHQTPPRQQTPPRASGSGEKPIDGRPWSPLTHGSIGGQQTPPRSSGSGEKLIDGRPWSPVTHGSGGNQTPPRANGSGEKVVNRQPWSPVTHGSIGGHQTPPRTSSSGENPVYGQQWSPVRANVELNDQPRLPLIDRKEQVKQAEESRMQSPGKEREKSEVNQPQIGGNS